MCRERVSTVISQKKKKKQDVYRLPCVTVVLHPRWNKRAVQLYTFLKIEEINSTGVMGVIIDTGKSFSQNHHIYFFLAIKMSLFAFQNATLCSSPTFFSSFPLPLFVSLRLSCNGEYKSNGYWSLMFQ